LDSQSLILIVDDQPRSQMALASLLEPEGYRIAYASTGLEALTQMRLLAPDLVLLDVMMPEMDGFEVCRRLRADPALALIPVVMITALDDHASLLQGIESGADDFIAKPFNREELRARVRTITRLNRFRVLLDEHRMVVSEHAQFLWAIERSADGYLLLDHEDRPQDGNPKGWQYLGLSRQTGQGCDQTFRDLAARLYQLAPKDAWVCWPNSVGMTRYLVRPDGNDPALWLQVELLDQSEGATGNRLVRLQDVTAKVSAQRDSWAFHSFVSHKLRTPLTSLVIGMGLLNRRTRQLPPDLAMLTETAYGGAQRLKSVVDDIFCYIETSTLLTPGNGVLLASVPDLITQIGNDLGMTAIQISIPFSFAACRLTVSARTVELLLTEILENAQKFHPHHTPTVSVGLLCQDGRTIISVIDDGMTLTPTQMQRIWEPYHQIDESFTGQVPGVGLGLATVAQICWAAGGTCRVTNRHDGPGITVELELPMVEDVEYLHPSAGDASPVPG